MVEIPARAAGTRAAGAGTSVEETGGRQAMTNEEKIRQMTTKELAGLIACGSTVFSCKDCKYNHRIGTCKMEDCKKAIIEWLGAEAEKD